MQKFRKDCFMNYYNEIKEKLIDDEIYSKVKDYSKERHKVITYYEIGRLLNVAGNKYEEHTNLFKFLKMFFYTKK